jgi:hypothetical protein
LCILSHCWDEEVDSLEKHKNQEGDETLFMKLSRSRHAVIFDDHGEGSIVDEN